MWRYLTIHLCLLLALAADCRAELVAYEQPPITIDRSPLNLSISRHFVYFEDLSGGVDYRAIHLVAQDAHWLPVPDRDATLGNVRHPVWLHVKLENAGAAGNWFLQIKNASIDQVDVYFERRSGALEHYHYTAKMAVKARPFPHSDFVAPLKVEASETLNVWIRATSSGWLDLPAVLQDEASFHHSSIVTATFAGLFYGIALAMVLYNFFLFVALRDWAYLYYIGFTFSLAMVFASIDGIVFGYLFSGFALTSAVSQVFWASITQIFGCAFAISFLSLKKRSPTLLLLFQILLVLCITPLIFLPFIQVGHLFNLTTATALITFVVFIGAGGAMWYQGYSYAKYYTLAWGALCAIAVFVCAAVLGIIDASINQLFAWFRLSAVIEMMLLALALAARIQYLQQTQREVLYESQAKTDLIARVSQEIRTPMNGILGLSELLREHLTNDTARKYNSLIYQSGSALLGIINDLLDLAKIQSQKIVLEEVNFNLHQLCEECVKAFQPKAQEKGLTLECQVAEDVPLFVRGDQARLKQVLMNFIANGCKYTERGEIVLKLTRAADEQHPHRLKFMVRDTGPGIDAERAAVIFDGEAGLVGNPSGGGRGLGLYISKQLVNLMGGKVGVTSLPGDGASFWLLLSLEPVDASDLVVSEVDGQVRFQKHLHILVAEDNRVNQVVIQKMLERLGHQVLLAENGAQAVALFKSRKGQFDLILMDCDMPVMDGFEATREIRALSIEQGWTQIPIWALTAHVQPHSKEQCVAAGMNDHLSKPIQSSSLAQALKGVEQLVQKF
ncbi:response regulator [Simiduia sp. 21SJ11W-1]|uniref:hybrid sensor histidine kinase/response regulator n=1 Tax=Simiduia sp. 21SJ11W-1 TaxID=2909669 RepID=UPI00209D3824|nr:hybrid sensor histidine kinase/response regulator [Simiduia sp. 21SJ11W-1]UTA49265.1 response regulator [Simiduia sp. 21SJ11W-1]